MVRSKKGKAKMEKNRDLELIQIIPSNRQLIQQQMEFYGFIHFTVNTFTGKEWGDGTESEAIFSPVCLDTDQWVEIAKATGMKGLILTCKHHDGFCLWPSSYTAHTIANSPYKNGKGDIVREFSNSCKKFGIKFGVYLSPWDRNHTSYGEGTQYDDYFIAQLTELLTNYGDVFTVWLDGACGEGKNGKKQEYDWERYYAVIRKLQPNACISVCGPDIRWCGNEAGDTRESEWSIVPKRLSDKRIIAENSQQADDAAFRQRKISTMDQDLGSRSVLEGEKDLIWYPAEVDVSIRPGWFYHPQEDEKVRSLEELKQIYLHSVGGNAMLLLNIPPTKEGTIHKNDEKRLRQLGDWIHNTFKENVVEEAELFANKEVQGHAINAVREDNNKTWYEPVSGTKKTEIQIVWQEEKVLEYLVLKEAIWCSQRIEEFEVYAMKNGKEILIYHGTTVGYKKIVELNAIKTSKLIIRIFDARTEQTLYIIGLF